MQYRVEITESAANDIEEASDWLDSKSEKAAERWIDGLLEAIESLQQFPNRCQFAPESDDHFEEIRQLLYGHYRILYIVRKASVFVLHVRHTARHLIRDLDVNPE